MFKPAEQGTGTISDVRRAFRLRAWRAEHRGVIRAGKWAFFLTMVAICIAAEMQTSWLQSRVLAATSRQLFFRLEPGPSPATLPPASGPYDRRLGYDKLPSIQARLDAAGFEVSAQARSSPLLRRVRELTLFPVYAEKSQAGLQVLDFRNRPLFSRTSPERIYARFADIPPLVVKSLLFVENRELLNAPGSRRNPAVEWDRLAKALLDLGLRQVSAGHAVSGGSTLATQLEKVRHSPEGLTGSVPEKARQMASASLRSYMEGEDTQAARNRIALDYVNSLPLASLPGYGEVTGLGDGLWTWYGADFNDVNRLLKQSEDGGPDPEKLKAQADAYRQVLSLLLAVKKPSAFLLQDRPGLEIRVDNFLRLLAEEGIIGPRFRDATLRARPRGRFRLLPDAARDYTARKAADSVRVDLLRLLGLDSAYDLDRLDMTVQTSLDSRSGDAAGQVLKRLADPEYAAAAGIVGDKLLAPDGLVKVIYSFALYERTPGANLLRIQVDNLDQPMNVSQNTKLEMGSTAKLRTLVTYLEIVAELHAQQAAAHQQDSISQWAASYLASAPDRSLPAMLEAAMTRNYSASPGESFFTGGGLHQFSNFDPKDNGRVITVREAFQQSINLVFIRVMRDIANYYMFRRSDVTPGILENEDDPRRAVYLKRFADREGTEFLKRFYAKYRGLTADEALTTLLAGLTATPQRLAAIHRFVRPRGAPDEFCAFLGSQPAARNLSLGAMLDLYEAYGPERFDLNDRGYLAHVHPLELWLLEYMSRRPRADMTELQTASAPQRQEVYRWLMKNGRKQGQNTRIRTLLEADAFAEIHKGWKRVGYPFPALVPSYATAIGSSGDNPAALAELLGILQSGGLRYPAVRIQGLHFAAQTPFETVMIRKPSEGERVMAKEVAARVREEMLGVVANGTGRRAFGSVVLGNGQSLPVGGKTGTGDNRVHSYGPGGWEIGSHAINRTASFAFLIGDRFYGTVMAYVLGADAANYGFTSALPVQVFTRLMPAIRPLLDPPSKVSPSSQRLAALHP